ncbi:hypothetical protein [Nereida sp. MMG025]|uniref:hypothetical protein n=1 Tax=Nereida sp. MMG025 TaxID=2909981 RepID=UPI001F34535E|nr:hypothetical protein [Nereida sp. MMG025]MCF6443624.1 hypothetical protein [Nereida sp. MMG025]
MSGYLLRNIGGIFLAFGVIWFGVVLDTYRFGLKRLNDLFPQLAEHPSGAYILMSIGVGLLIAGDIKDRMDRRVTASKESNTPGLAEPSRPTRKAVPTSQDGRTPKQRPRPTGAVPDRPLVWCSRIFVNHELFTAYAGPQDTPEARKSETRLFGYLERGMPLAAEEFPKRVRAMDSPAPKLKPFTKISGRLPMVSEDLAACLARLDLGDGSFVPTAFEDEAGKPLPHRHLFWNIASQKKVLLPHECRGLIKHNPRHNRKVAEQWYPPDMMQDDDFAVSEAALIGADIWVDFILPSVVFFSDGCKQHLEAAGYGDLFPWHSVRVI